MIARVALLSAVTVVVLAAFPTVAHAQYQGGLYHGRSDNPNGPTVSPYLNLLQNNNPLTGQPTYQSLVKPLLEQQDAIQRQGNSLQQLQQQVNTTTPRGNGQRGTGHTTFFMNFSHYYPAPRR